MKVHLCFTVCLLSTIGVAQIEGGKLAPVEDADDHATGTLLLGTAALYAKFH